MTKAFSVLLQDINSGRTHAELSTKMGELLTTVRETGKAGSLTLQINVKPASKGSFVDKVIISDKVTLKTPELARAEDFFWLDDKDEPTRNHPKQSSLDLRDASAPSPITFKEANK